MKAIQMTMFHVCNYGAALQTYALQRFIESEVGWQCETLNLEPHWHGRWSFDRVGAGTCVRRSRLLSFLRFLLKPQLIGKRVRQFFQDRYRYRPWREMFAKFQKDEIHLTCRYDSKAAVIANPPWANLYITGSDQTLNPRFTGGEGTWFFDFLTPEQKSRSLKITYASSFGMGKLPVEFAAAYRDGLSRYHALSVREAGGATIARQLGLFAEHCCDPTILLTRMEWAGFSAKSKRKMRKPYILSYNLRYAVDPVPYNEDVERQVSAKLHLPIVHLYERTMEKLTRTGRIVRDADLYDFVKLFMEASFVLTSSYHGVVFSLIFQKPFLAYVNANHETDCRAYDLLSKCGATRHSMEIPCRDVKIGNWEQYKCGQSELNAFARFREDSARWLREQMRKVAEMV